MGWTFGIGAVVPWLWPSSRTAILVAVLLFLWGGYLSFRRGELRSAMPAPDVSTRDIQVILRHEAGEPMLLSWAEYAGYCGQAPGKAQAEPAAEPGAEPEEVARPAAADAIGGAVSRYWIAPTRYEAAVGDTFTMVLNAPGDEVDNLEQVLWQADSPKLQVKLIDKRVCQLTGRVPGHYCVVVVAKRVASDTYGVVGQASVEIIKPDAAPPATSRSPRPQVVSPAPEQPLPLPDDPAGFPKY